MHRIPLVAFILALAACQAPVANRINHEPTHLPSIEVRLKTDFIRRPSSLVQDEWGRWAPTAEPVSRAHLAVDDEVPVGLSREQAIVRALELARAHLRVGENKLRVYRVSEVLRLSKPSFLGWSVTLAQTFRGTSLFNCQNTPRESRDIMGGVTVNIFSSDDYDLSVNLWEARPIPATNRRILSRVEATALALKLLQLEGRPHHFTRFELGYAFPRQTEDEDDPPEPGARGYWTKASSERLIPAWMVIAETDLDFATLHSFRAAHKGGFLILDAVTGAQLAGTPMPDDPAAWDRYQQIAGDWSEQQPALRRCLESIHVGMTEAQTDEILRPQTLAKGNLHRGGTGSFTRYYHLLGDLEVLIDFGGSTERGIFLKVDSVCEVRPKTTWKWLTWEPTEADLLAATKVLTASWKPEDPVGLEDSRKHYAHTPAPKTFAGIESVPIELPGVSGEKWVFIATGEGTYNVNRLVELYLYRDGELKGIAKIDLDESRVITTSWNRADEVEPCN